MMRLSVSVANGRFVGGRAAAAAELHRPRLGVGGRHPYFALALRMILGLGLGRAHLLQFVQRLLHPLRLLARRPPACRFDPRSWCGVLLLSFAGQCRQMSTRLFKTPLERVLAPERG